MPTKGSEAEQSSDESGSFRKWILSPIVGVSVAAAVGLVTLLTSVVEISGLKLDTVGGLKIAIAFTSGILGSILGYYFGRKKKGGNS
jgi:flagellar motor component MotA